VRSEEDQAGFAVTQSAGQICSSSQHSNMLTSHALLENSCTQFKSENVEIQNTHKMLQMKARLSDV
jgi:hypothetical protein